MKTRLTRIALVPKFASAVLAVTLGGCNSIASVSAVNSTAMPASTSVAVSPPSVTLTGQLVLFGPDLDAWLGVRDATGRVTRLVFQSKEEFAAQRMRQNKNVTVTGSPLPAYLGRPQVQVTDVQLQP